jgi:hypothetical protein
MELYHNHNGETFIQIFSHPWVHYEEGDYIYRCGLTSKLIRDPESRSISNIKHKDDRPREGTFIYPPCFLPVSCSHQCVPCIMK